MPLLRCTAADHSIVRRTAVLLRIAAVSGVSVVKKMRPFCRQTSSLTLFLSGIIVLITSLVLYMAPPTHIAHFSDWRLAGLSKCQWNALHIMAGLLFIIVMLAHVYFNWKTILFYLKNKKRKVVVFTRPFAVSLVLTFYVCGGTLYELPPMGQLIDWLRSVKIVHVQTYGTPPFGRAESASMESVAQYMGWDSSKSLAALRQQGFRVESKDQPIEQIARNNGTSTGVVLSCMQNEGTRKAFAASAKD